MKGIYSMWVFFGLTLWIDIMTHLLFPGKRNVINPYVPARKVSVIIPVHREPEKYVEKTIRSLYRENYPLHNVIVCGDGRSGKAENVVKRLSRSRKNLFYYECEHQSKAMKINCVVQEWSKKLGGLVYVRDCRVCGEEHCIENMVSYFSDRTVGAVTSYGRVSIPRNFLSRSYFYGKAWVNEVGRFRKTAQEKRNALFVICGASSMFRTKVLKKIPIPSSSKTEDTYYTWLLQRQGYKVRVADNAVVSAPEVDGPWLRGIRGQIKQSYRWSSGTIQCIYCEGGHLFKNKKLAYTTIVPGFVESIMYSIPLVFFPLFLMLFPNYAVGFLIGDTLFSLLGTLLIIPKKFFKTLVHYPQIVFFKYLNALIFLCALVIVSTQALAGRREKWSNEWISPQTQSHIVEVY